jgi:hypothetical protein
MQVEELVCPEEKAKTELASLKANIKKVATARNSGMYLDLKRVYGHIQKYGGTIIDVLQSIQKAGLNADFDPKLAIVRADSSHVYCLKHASGSCGFHHEVYWNPFGYQTRPSVVHSKRPDVSMPSASFNWKRGNGVVENAKIQYDWQIDRVGVKAPTPLVPASILNLVDSDLKNYFILWEVEKWEQVPPKDPMLLKQLTPNLYAVMATWDLTELERAVIRGRL